MFGSATVYLPVVEYIRVEHGDNKEWHHLEKELERADPDVRAGLFEELTQAWNSGEFEEREKMLDVAEALTHKERSYASLQHGCLPYEKREVWWAAVDTAAQDLDPVFSDRIEAGGLDIDLVLGYVKRDQRLPVFMGHGEITRRTLATFLDVGYSLTRLKDDDWLNQQIDQHGVELAELEAAKATKESLNTLVRVRSVLLTDAHPENALELLEDGLRALRSDWHFTKDWQGGRINWQRVSVDWHQHRLYIFESEEGVPEDLRHSYNPDLNAITQLTRALAVPEERITTLIKQIATPTEKGSRV